MKVITQPNRTTWGDLLKRPVFDLSELEGRVLPVLQAIRQRGDEALREFTQKFDQVEIDSFLVSQEEISAAANQLDDSLKAAIQTAKSNIEAFHRAQKEEFEPVETTPGVRCWRKSVPIQKVGLYIPGGTAPLFSTVLMLAVPAQVAGCQDIVLCSPPTTNGSIHPAILYAANLCGVTQIFKAGGGQAIAAMAYGTETIPQVSKIFGPGNQYVTLAKQLVSKEGVAIDLPAGPSEVAVMADASANPAFIAADLLSQAEHGVDSQVLLVSTDEEMIARVQAALADQLARLPRMEIAAQALENSTAVFVKQESDMVDLINAYAPEHLIISTENCDELAGQITQAGSVFLGAFTPESVGDYASGTNHTLPTNGYATAYSGVSLDSFVKKITFQKLTPAGLRTLGPVVEIMAEAEELVAHKEAVSIRLKTLNSDES
ncbi:histidinol dehydrogenase [Pontibacter sp. G13]|uniref:histidinol dehydrogenase n=1 Tax=Pontibacter sp. G13 TaxID=3074898 RepID=UPI00288B863D|nr:histidinol dehydrogenase [Pontibacter sp. G13]WNJ18723.1 histidinol dehydrogenase [Pontibacter sp. G13]